MDRAARTNQGSAGGGRGESSTSHSPGSERARARAKVYSLPSSVTQGLSQTELCPSANFQALRVLLTGGLAQPNPGSVYADVALLLAG